MKLRMPQQQTKVRKLCIFCDRAADSKEHFWPEWMHELLPQLPDPRHSRQSFTYHPSGAQDTRGVDGRQGAVHTIKMRVVCSDCNNGWMNRLERDVRPFLTPLIEWQPIALDFEQMAVIARWIAVKCIVAEHADADTSVTPKVDRIAMREHGTIPAHFRIYAANHNVQNSCWYYRHSVCLGANGPVIDPPLDGTSRNVQTISFTLGGLFVHVNAARAQDFEIESWHSIPLFHQNSRLWPFQHHEMVWPRRPLLDLKGMGLIAGTLTTIIEASNLTWIDVSP